jgi:CBS domain-containing protein
MTEKETVNNEENAAFAEENAAFAEENAAFAEEAESATEETAVKEGTEAVGEEAAEAGEAEAVKEAESEASAEAESEEKAEEATLTEDETAPAEEAESAAEETAVQEGTEAVGEEAVEAGEAEAVKESESEVSAEAESEEKAEEATLTGDETAPAEEAESAAEETAAKEATEAVGEEAVEAGEAEAVKEAESEASAEAESEEKAEEATLTGDETAPAEEAESAAEETAAKEGTEAVGEEAVEASEAEPVKEAESEASADVEGGEKEAAISGTGVESEVIELSTESLKTFCGDVTGMFGAEMKCKRQPVATETIEGLKERFGSLVAVNSVKAEGALDGTFHMVFNREGLFTLAGLIVMPQQMTSLMEKAAGPEKILENIKRGSLKEAEGMSDAMAEAGNMLVGAWNRIFREGLKDHGQFVQSNTFIGNPWEKPEEKIDLSSYEELLFVSYEMSIGSYPSFACGVIFPRTVFAGAEEKARLEAEARARAEAEARARAEAEAKAKTEAEEQAKAEAEEKAKAEDEEKAKAEVEEKTKAEDEEKAATMDETDDSKEQPVSDTIQKMTQSSAVLPGESGSPTSTEKAAVSDTREILAMCAKDIMQKEVVWGNPEDSVQQTLTKMQQHDVGYMVVGLDEVMEGIVSRSDLTGAISPYLRPVFAKWRRPLDDATLQIKIKWIMSRPVHTIKPETSLEAIMENMRQFGGHCLAVVDQEAKVQGLVTVFDIFQDMLSSDPNISSVGKTPQAPPLI